FAFADVMKNQEKSEYLDWYYIEGFPLVREWGRKPNFKCFSYFGGMPKLNLSNPEVQDYCIGVARYWIRECDIDGWRLDVGDEISHVFWKRFRREVKAQKPEALILGAVWHSAPDFLAGDEWDSVMNYPFKDAVKELLADGSITVSQYAGRLGFIRGNVHTDVYPVLLNLIGSHDCPRFLHECGGDAQRLKMAAALQLLSPGMPMIYYGDEYAMEGGKDPDCRRGMVWEESRQNGEVYDWYRRLIRVRKEHPSLTAGKILSLRAEDEKGLLVIVKSDGNEKTVTMFHCGTEKIDLPEYAGLSELLREKKFEGRLGAMEAAVLIVNGE
ncbi:MAG: glycoside hydrolase family 13 protein, partial [Lachnospiraceae bacterium]|nr:glycoside hydrolase family 13 protein [Lachnospiraceae bacterium]